MGRDALHRFAVQMDQVTADCTFAVETMLVTATVFSDILVTRRRSAIECILVHQSCRHQFVELPIDSRQTNGLARLFEVRVDVKSSDMLSAKGTQILQQFRRLLGIIAFRRKVFF